MYDLLRWVGAHFSAEQYLFWTRIQATAWTAADLLLISSLIGCANLCRRRLGRRPHVLSSYALAATVLPAIYLPVAPNGRSIFLIELLSTVPHFLLLLYLFLSNLHTGPAALSAVLGSSGTGSGQDGH